MRSDFIAEQWLPYDLPRVFLFFADPANLPRLMPPSQDARIETLELVSPSDVQIPEGMTIAGAGTRMTITVRPFPLLPIRLPWDALINEFHFNQGFCDVQLRGPFRYWRHCHTLRAEERDGIQGTVVRDAVEYEPPFGPLGKIADAVFLRRNLAATFAFRQQRTLELLAAL